MITVRKIGGQTAHRATQDGTWAGAPLFTRTLCGQTIKVGEWAELIEGQERSVVGYGPSFLLQPCKRCEKKAEKITSPFEVVAEGTASGDDVVLEWDDTGQPAQTATGYALAGEDQREVVELPSHRVVARWNWLPRPDAVRLETVDGELIGMPASDRASVLIMTSQYFRRH